MRLLTTTFIATLSLSSFAADWQQWRGPTGNGTSPDAKPPIEWSGTKNVRWKLAIPGVGSGSPVISGDNIFVVTAVDTETKPKDGVKKTDVEAPETLHQFVVMCVDRKTGKERWKRTTAELVPHAGHHEDHGYASASPITDGKHVWAHFGSRGTFCLTVDGDLVWSRTDLGKMTTRGGFGDGSSPALHGDKLVVPWDHEGDSYIIALNKDTGDTIWKTDRDEPSCWASPLIVEHKGKALVIQSGENFARAYDLADGKEVWRAAGQTSRPVASPVAADGIAYICSGFRGSFLGAYKLDGAKGDLTDSKSVVWSLEKGTPDIASPVLSGDLIYFHSGKDGMLSCHNAKNGEAHYKRERIAGLRRVYASPVAANGHVYLSGRDGTTVVIKDGPKLEIVTTNKLGEGIDASPALVGGEIFLRGAKHLFCIKEEG